MKKPSLYPGMLMLAALACGNSSAQDELPDAGSDVDAAASELCADAPCRTFIAEVAHWDEVAGAADQRCDLDQYTKFLLPATNSAALDQTVYQDVGANAYHVDFMRDVLSEYFAGMTPEDYYRMVQRRATREYYAGTIHRVVDEDGEVVGYGFDVYVDPANPDELLTDEELDAVAAGLGETFELPLVYAPIATPAVDRARTIEELTVPIHLPRLCQVATCPDPETSCLLFSAPGQLCGTFGEGRTITQEYRALMTLETIAGGWTLPGPGLSMAVDLFPTGLLGPEKVPIQSDGDGLIVATTQGEAVQYTYTQSMSGAEDTVELRAEFWLVPGQQFDALALADKGWFTVFAEVNGANQYQELRFLESCSYAALDLFHINGTIAGGDSFQLRVRHEIPMAGSGPLNIIGASASLGGAAINVDDYFQLIYAGEHHNWNNQFWVLFSSPVTVDQTEVHGLWVDEEAYTNNLEAAWLLDADHKPVIELDVTGYSWDTP